MCVFVCAWERIHVIVCICVHGKARDHSDCSSGSVNLGFETESLNGT